MALWNRPAQPGIVVIDKAAKTSAAGGREVRSRDGPRNDFRHPVLATRPP